MKESLTEPKEDEKTKNNYFLKFERLN